MKTLSCQYSSRVYSLVESRPVESVLGAFVSLDCIHGHLAHDLVMGHSAKVVVACDALLEWSKQSAVALVVVENDDIAVLEARLFMGRGSAGLR